MLLSVPGKVLCGVNLEKLSTAVYDKLRDNQAAFRQLGQRVSLGAYETLCDSWEICHLVSQHLCGQDMQSHMRAKSPPVLRVLLESSRDVFYHHSCSCWLLTGLLERLQQTREMESSGHCQLTQYISHNLRQLQEKTSDLANNSAQLGLNIHRRKTKILRLTTTTEHPVTLKG